MSSTPALIGKHIAVATPFGTQKTKQKSARINSARFNSVSGLNMQIFSALIAEDQVYTNKWLAKIGKKQLEKLEQTHPALAKNTISGFVYKGKEYPIAADINDPSRHIVSRRAHTSSPRLNPDLHSEMERYLNYCGQMAKTERKVRHMLFHLSEKVDTIEEYLDNIPDKLHSYISDAIPQHYVRSRNPGEIFADSPALRKDFEEFTEYLEAHNLLTLVL